MILLTNISQLLTLRGSTSPRRGKELADVGLVRDGAVLCEGGRIIVAGPQRAILSHRWLKKNKKKISEIDCTGKTVTPGFVDSHTHLVFAAPRLIDFEQRIQGATYQAIAKAGGGIRSSVLGVRKASRGVLAKGALDALEAMARHGTTTVEAKSGYGLSLAAEIKSLEAIRDAAKRWPGTVIPTLLGAHVVPAEHKSQPERYLREVCEQMIPQAARKKLAQFVDVFCEEGAFSLEQSRQVFAAAVENGLRPRAHVGQFSACSLSPLLRYGPASFDHMDHYAAADLNLLSKSNTVCTLVPGANYFLGKPYPNARELVSAGVAVALATDYNPGTSPTTNMQFILSLACTQMRMSPPEAIAAATIQGAHALRLADRKGSVEEGKDADFAIFDVKDYRELCYWVGGNLCEQTIINGETMTTTQKISH
ncbi:MAG TPA: imidazolonepropionase [Terriglobales bacterium]|nr:imidazolonepropionase [Terriglobales bacterium]